MNNQPLRPDLQLMADKALRACPTIAYVNGGTRAEHGAALLQDGQIVVKSAGVWSIGNHTVTRSTCSCDDLKAPVTTAGTKLCKHVYGVLMLLASEKSSDALCEFLMLNTQPDMVVMQLTIVTPYNENTRHIVQVGQSHLARRVPVPQGEPVNFTQFSSALKRLGWSLVEFPKKLAGNSGYDYRWKLRMDTGGIALTENIWHMRGVTAEMIERRANLAQVEKFVAGMLARDSAAPAA